MNVKIPFEGDLEPSLHFVSVIDHGGSGTRECSMVKKKMPVTF
jgi:hypothetical protein